MMRNEKEMLYLYRSMIAYFMLTGLHLAKKAVDVENDLYVYLSVICFGGFIMFAILHMELMNREYQVVCRSNIEHYPEIKKPISFQTMNEARDHIKKRSEIAMNYFKNGPDQKVYRIKHRNGAIRIYHQEKYIEWYIK